MRKMAVAVVALASLTLLTACVDRNQWWGESPRRKSPYSPDRDWDRCWDGDDDRIRTRADWKRDWENRHERYWDRNRRYDRSWR